MTYTTRLQSLAGIATVLALPLLYLGATANIPAVTAAGLTVFALAMLTTPTLRVVTEARTTPQDGAARMRLPRFRHRR